MSVLKTSLANPSRMQGIFRYLLYAKEQREKREVLEQIISPNKLVEHINDPRPMFRAALNESLKCRLLIEDDSYITINPDLPEKAKSIESGNQQLPNTFANLFFTSGNKDEEDFGYDCAWYLAQDIYDTPGTWEDVQKKVHQQKAGEFLRLSNNSIFGHLGDWMCYLGLAWSHSLGGKVLVPDPTVYIRRNLKSLFSKHTDDKILLNEFINRLAVKCPLFETGKFREAVEEIIGQRQANYLSTSTAFALFRLQDEGYIQLIRESDADLTILPKANAQVDDDGRVSHIIYCDKS
ncbi:protein DpdG [Chlorogloea sp. CCALA 695]|uniref:protein DpdG n=1 Tax=Chlorogloea sp. CCALA 695 TaxID=2107693 RepID=UPI000D07A0FF|nr:protein DpdG [Chlorogloea sp. CCALA 695]PSB33290.1 hypothetical protein C7B70_06990 [Chlorogloea sp. CCALA 695]